MRPRALYCRNKGAMIATAGKKLIARIRVITGLLNRNLSLAIAYAAIEPKNRHTTVVTPEMMALLRSACWKAGSLKIWAYSAPVGFAGRIVGGDWKSSARVMMLILKIQISGNMLTRTKRNRNT
jgi:hypothetical protein